MARQEDTCWRCGASWIDHEPVLVTRRTSPEAAAWQRAGTPARTISTTSSPDVRILAGV